MNKRVLITVLLPLFCLIFLMNEAPAAPAAPVEVVLTQADGSKINARQWGDEWMHGWRTADGYSIVFNETSRNWVFAIHNNEGDLGPSTAIVGRHAPPAGVKPFLRPAQGSPSRMMGIERKSAPVKRAAPTTGTNKLAVLMVNFSDTTVTYGTSDFESLLFDSGNYSLKDYYEEVSYGKFSVSSGSNGVTGWYTASNIHDYYGENDMFGYDKYPGTLVNEAVQAADSTVDFSQYDMDGDCYVDVVAIIHQGTGEEAGGPTTDIWSHRWDLNSAGFFGDGTGEYTTNDTASCGTVKVNDYIIMPEILWGGQSTIGVFAHEYAHSLALPDLYDIDGTSQGIGYWGLMAAGAWTFETLPGDRPSHLCAWSKYFLGWVSPTVVEGTLLSESIDAAAFNNDVYQILSGSPDTGGEYFLIENRQKVGFDSGLPGEGLAIWHIDESKATFDNTDNTEECIPSQSNCASSHYRVALVQADGRYGLEKNLDAGDSGDLYPGSTGNTSFASYTTPDSNLYNGSASGVEVTNISSSAMTMMADLSSEGEEQSDGEDDGDSDEEGEITGFRGISSNITFNTGNWCFDGRNQTTFNWGDKIALSIFWNDVAEADGTNEYDLYTYAKLMSSGNEIGLCAGDQIFSGLIPGEEYSFCVACIVQTPSHIRIETGASWGAELNQFDDNDSISGELGEVTLK